jgi:hypothetical protein
MTNFDLFTQTLMRLFLDVRLGLSLPLRRMLAILTASLLDGPQPLSRRWRKPCRTLRPHRVGRNNLYAGFCPIPGSRRSACSRCFSISSVPSYTRCLN